MGVFELGIQVTGATCRDWWHMREYNSGVVGLGLGFRSRGERW